jgi:PAS domain S-box-containing protein
MDLKHENRQSHEDIESLTRQLAEHQALENRLRESEEQHRSLFTNMKDGLAVCEMIFDEAGWPVDFSYVQLNPAALQALDCTRDDMVGKTGRQANPTLPEFVFETVARVLLTGEPADFELYHPTQDKHFDYHAYRIARSRFALLFRDVTGRKRAEQAVLKSEQRLRIAKDAAKLGIYDYDVVSGTIMWDERVRQLNGVGPDTQITYDTFLSGLHPEDRAKTQALVDRALDPAGNGDYYAEYRVISRADGIQRWVAATGQVLFENGRVHMIGTGQDISERKEAETALRDSYLQYKEVFDNISVCVFLVDVTPDGRFKFVGFNPAEEEAVGLSSAEVSGRLVEEVFDKDLANKLTANYRRCLEAGRAIKYDDALNLPRGLRYFHSNLIPLRNAAGVIHRIIGACIDITDFRRTQEEALAKQNLESLGVLAGGIAHDFNNVLGGIHAQAELIEIDLDVGSAPRDEIQKIKASTIRASEIVRELMVYAGQDQAHFAEGVEVSRLVLETLELLKLSISKHAALRTDLAEDLPAVSGNAVQIRQILMNLVINASEAIGQKDGVIVLTAAHVRAGSDASLDRATDLPQGDFVRLEVTDTGCGITDEARAKIFDPFFSTKFAGRGMGLAVVQRIVRDHGGAINVVSAVGKGTTVQVFLPCGVTSASGKQGAIPVNSPEFVNHRSGTILLVEDEDLLRAAVSKSLRKIGFLVIEASDGTDATKLLREHKDDLDAVLLDVTLPGTPSREVLEEGLRLRPDLRVVVTSAYSKETVDASFAGLGAHSFIRKPFHLADVVRLLRDTRA